MQQTHLTTNFSKVESKYISSIWYKNEQKGGRTSGPAIDRNTDKQAESVTYQQWHHNFFFALYEGSKPVNLVEICQQQDWQSVKTEVSFLNGLATTVVNYVAPIWYPKTVDVSCTPSEISNVN